MCSIYGYIGKNYKQIEETFSKELYHRGPDDKGIFYDDKKKVALGHTRLSIIDLSNHAHQPMIEDNYILVFNGEIYNYKDIRKELEKLGYKFHTNSDTEVVLKSYIEWKEKCVEKFRGMFAFCVYDRQKGELFLARDRFGIKPLIYGFIDNQFVFSSELKPILNSNLFPKKLNYQAVNDYFRYGSIKQPNTILENFTFLMPSCYMQVDIKSLKYEIKKYYDYVNNALKLPKINSYEEAVKQVRNELETATSYHMVADVEVGAFLSGGVDSTAVVALMKKYSQKQINTFSVGFKHKTNVEDETEIATRTAKYLGCNHHNIKIDDKYVVNIFDDFISSIDQPSIDGINTYIVSLETATEMKVALSGLGGDEIFAGYPHFKTISEYSNKESNLISFFGKRLNSMRPNRFTNKYEYIGNSEEENIEYLRSVNKSINMLKFDSSIAIQNTTFKQLSSIQRISKYEIDNYMLNTLLRDNDVLSMAHSLEVRPILLDHKLVELAFSLDDSFKVKNGMLKSVFVDSIKDIIPSEVWQRKKTGFEMPFASWLNGGLNEKFKQVIQNKQLEEIFKRDFLDNLKFKIQNSKLIRSDWMSFIFMCWLDKYEVEV